MDIVSLNADNTAHRTAVAELLREAFPHSYGDSAEGEVESLLEAGKVAIVALVEGRVVGFAGAMPQYGCTGWELHPLAVRKDLQFGGIGTRLTEALEAEVARRGGITLYLGTDDEFGQTTLSGVNLYDDLCGHVTSIANPGRHPYEFYLKSGYSIVGVIPDANGLGKPDIIMAKRLKN
jgi:aminoglycoside 6'-N-acetyltransferase I